MARRRSAFQAWLETLPPYDDAALFGASGPMRRGDKHKPETIQLLRKRAQERQRKRLAEWERQDRERRLARRRQQNKTLRVGERLPRTLANVIAEAMEPGDWYAQPDVRALLPAIKRGSISGTLARMTRERLLERAENPEYRPTLPPHCGGDPRWLYRLTAEGERLRQGAGEPSAAIGAIGS